MYVYSEIRTDYETLILFPSYYSHKMSIYNLFALEMMPI